MTLRIAQYAYFGIYSSSMSAAEMSTFIGLEPDEVMIQGSRRVTNPPVPRRHAWKLRCDTPQMPVDEQVGTVIRRLQPRQAAICELTEMLLRSEGSAGGAVLRIIRHLDEPHGEADGYQHHLLGWHLSTEVLRFVVDVGAEIGVDEYGQELPWWQWRRRRRYYAPFELEDHVTAIATGDRVVSSCRGFRERFRSESRPQ